MTEQIGKITLDYKYYPGEDLYCDGEIEDEILDIVKKYKESEFHQVIEDRASWPIFYHLSPLRGNIVDWIPLDDSMKVLEVGSGCGAITGTLAKKAGSVTCIDLSKKRSYINAYRHQNYNNISINVGNFKDIETELSCDFDFIFLIGVFEYGQGYMGTDTPYEDFMSILKKHLKNGGRIVIAIENKLGLKYWAGCKEDHLGNYFSGIEDYPNEGGVRTFTRNGLEKICIANDIYDYSFYYPYPDYKFMTCLYSDDRLPKVGELSTNWNNYDRERLLLFDEEKAFDTIIRENLFSLYSNSYILVTGEALNIKYAKFSNDRDDRFAVHTDMVQDREGNTWIQKTPCSEAAKKHIQHIQDSYEKLAERYEGSSLEINQCEKNDKGIALEYLEGTTLEVLLDNCLDKNDIVTFLAYIEKYIEIAKFGEEKQIVNYDLIFSNILIHEGNWRIIDYEWTFEKHIPAKEIIFRALYCYSLGAMKRKDICRKLVQDKLDLSKGEEEKLIQKEIDFQKYVTGNRFSLIEMWYKIGRAVIPVRELAESYMVDFYKNRVQIYEDKGTGFSEEKSYFLKNAYKTQSNIEFTLRLSKDVVKVRIDPSLSSCLIMVKSLTIDGNVIKLKTKNLLLNGDLISEELINFSTEDPNITIVLEENKDQELHIEMDVVKLPIGITNELAKGKQKRKIFGL